MSRGRKRKPARLRLIEGNKGKRPIPKEPELAEPSDAEFEPPVILQASARREWDRIFPALHAAGILKITDLGTLAMYCQAVGRFRDASEMICKLEQEQPDAYGLLTVNQKGGVMENPIIGTARRAALDAVRIGAEFGLTPATRAKLGVIDNAGESPLDKYLP